MHYCNYCGKEFEGRFCPECGTEYVDERKRCRRCGNPVSDDAKFCNRCGARLDGKVTCPNCGRESEESATYCEVCGTKLSAYGCAVSKGKISGVKSVLSVIGVVCLILSCLCGFAFTFACGITASSGDVSETMMLYDYFGEAYKGVDATKEAIKSLFNFATIGTSREFAIYFPIVSGTVISALGILCAAVCAALTAWKAYKKLYKKQKANVVAPAAGTYLGFAVLATALLFLNSLDFSGVKTSLSTSDLRYITSGFSGVKTSFSAPTLAGLITGGVFLGAGVLLLAIANIGKLRDNAAKVGVCGAVLATVFAVLVISFASLPSAGLKSTVAISSAELISGGKFGIYSLMQSMLYVVKDSGAINKIITFGAIGGIGGLATAITVAVFIVRKLSGVSRCANKSGIISGAFAVIFAVLYLTFSVLTLNAVLDAVVDLYADGNDQVLDYISKNFAAPIVMLIMSVLAYASEIFAKVTPKFIRPLQDEQE